MPIGSRVLVPLSNCGAMRIAPFRHTGGQDREVSADQLCEAAENIVQGAFSIHISGSDESFLIASFLEVVYIVSAKLIDLSISIVIDFGQPSCLWILSSVPSFEDLNSAIPKIVRHSSYS